MNIIEESFKTITPVSDNVHMIFKNLFKRYILVGGFPDAIVSFMKNHNAIESYRKNEKIIFDMKSDFGRRKGRDGNAKSSKTVMSHPEHYGVTKLIKIGDYNIGKKDDILTIPHYMTYLLGKRYDEEELVFEKIELNIK